MGHMDQGFKALVDLRTEEMVRFVTGDQQAEYLETLAADVAMERQLVLDSLYRIRSQGAEHLIDMEAQAYPDARMARRMFEYGVRANLIYNLPVLSIVIWFFKGEAVPRPPYQIRIGKRVVASWDFINIELYKLPASAIMGIREVGLLPLVPFTRGATTGVVETAMRRIREESAEQDAQKLADPFGGGPCGRRASAFSASPRGPLLLGVFATRFHGQDFALDLVRRYFMSTELLQEFPLFRSMMAEAEAKGMREIIARQLEQRFGPMSQEMTAALSAADAPTLTELAVHVMTDTQEQLLLRLGLGGQQG